MKLRSTVRMRPPDPSNPDFYLLEELARPRASVTGSRVVIWVYSDSSIREIVISGHTESSTCRRATSILIDAGKDLEGVAEWMLTCGAGYIRVPHTGIAPAELPRVNAVLGEMLQKLNELAANTGAVEVVYKDWKSLDSFRRRFRARAAASEVQIILPDPQSPGDVVDYLPVTPQSQADGKPLIFRLEGWDFDSPEYQALVDLHLRNLQKELLRDALRRRRVYRGWLKGWFQDWFPRLSLLYESEVESIVLRVPDTSKSAGSQEFVITVGIRDFLNQYAEKFLDRGQNWPQTWLNVYSLMPFGQKSEIPLDLPERPKEIREIDFERGIERTRPATEDDPAITFRQRLTKNFPQLISSCLLYIHRMNAIIRPYEALALRNQADGNIDPREALKAQVVDQISRRIVMETMVRGWPSIFMEDERDQQVFQKWADKYRHKIWSIMARQARAANVPLELFLEDNIIYDVRFNADLGCTLQPLMLVDDASHVQVHGASVGASVVIPLWPRRQTKYVSEKVLRLARGNHGRAAELVRQAQALTKDGDVNSSLPAAALLRTALGCDPAHAGKLILMEWSARLGRDTQNEFKVARHLIEAAEWAVRRRYREAWQKARDYLAAESRPVGDAFVIAALAELMEKDDDKEKEWYQVRSTMRNFADNYNKLLPRIQEATTRVDFNPQFIPARLMNDIERLGVLKTELDRLDARSKLLEGELEAAIRERARLIKNALKDPQSVNPPFQFLAMAAAKAPEELRAVLESRCLYANWSAEMSGRYAETRKTIELRGLLDTSYALGLIRERLKNNPNQVRKDALEQMRKLADSLWLPEQVETDLKNVAEEFGKGDWDRLQSNMIAAILFESVQTCLSRIDDLLSDPIYYGTPLAEGLLTKIYIAQTLDRYYKTAFDMMLTATVPVARICSAPWEACDTAIEYFPLDGKLGFDAASRTIFLQTAEGQKPLLSCRRISEEEIQHVMEIVSDPQLPLRINRFAPNLAEGILAIEVEPSRRWRVWRDTMNAVSQELLFALGYFDYEATVLHEHAPLLTEAGKQAVRRMETLTPRETPLLDYQWRDLGGWNKWIASQTPTRLRDQAVQTASLP